MSEFIENAIDVAHYLRKSGGVGCGGRQARVWRFEVFVVFYKKSYHALQAVQRAFQIEEFGFIHPGADDANALQTFSQIEGLPVGKTQFLLQNAKKFFPVRQLAFDVIYLVEKNDFFHFFHA